MRKRVGLVSLIVLLAMLGGTLSMTRAQDDAPKVKLAENVPYLDDGDPRHILDFYAPVEGDNFPVLMFVSGGGWTQGSKDWIAHLGGILGEQGIGVVTIDHRLMPDVTIEEQVADLAAAFAWVADRLEQIGADPARVFVGGHSAGGQLMSLVALDGHYLEDVGHDRSEIAGVVLVSGALDVESEFGEDLAPLNFVDEDAPSFLLFVSDGDSANITNAAQTLESDLQAVDVPVEYIEVPNTDHFSVVVDRSFMDKLADWILEFPVDVE